ncbi:MAG: hypothetical protein PUG33_01345 [Mollicutes bacterium]|nr:hypothetical protein [Mollicutes bacterium]
MSNRTYNDDELNRLVENSSKISQNLEAISNDTTSYYDKIDSRILRKFSDTFSQINNYNGKIQDDIDNIDTYGNWLSQTLDDYTGTRNNVEGMTPDLSDISADVGDTSLGEGDASLKDLSSISSIIGSTVGGLGSADKAEQFPLDPEVWENLSGSEKESIVKKLKELGFTDEEINNIKDGKVSVDKVKLEELASQLEKLYKLDPSIRQKLKDLYGFDIFNDDGTVNKEKLAIAMLMDAKNPNDQYDLKTLLTKLNANTSTGNSGNKSTTGNVTKVVTNDIGGSSQTTSTIAGAAAGLGATVAAVGGTTSKATGLAASAEEEALAGDKSSDSSNKNSSLLDGLKSEMNHVINRIKPSGNISTKQGNAAIIAGAGLGTVSLAGGGIMAGKKIMMLVFKPEHFTNLSEVIKDTILNTFKALKFTEEELDLFMTSNLKIKASLIDDMITAIKKASELDTELNSKIKQVYNFSVFTENNKISKYLILMIMLIDGKKIGDKYNIYDILNPILAETDYVNYTYQGVSLQDIVVKEKEEKKESDKQQKEEAKQPVINANKEEILDENEDSKTSTTSTSSVESWLKEMGIDS